MKQRSGSSSLSALKLKSFTSLVKWCAAHYTITWNVTCLYRIFTGCVNARTDSGKVTGSVNEPKSDHPGTNHGTHFPCIFRNGCVKEAKLYLKSALRFSGSSVRPAYPGFIVMKIPTEGFKLISSSRNRNLQGTMVKTCLNNSYEYLFRISKKKKKKTYLFLLLRMASCMVFTCTATTDSTSTAIRLNSSKQPQAPVCARPLKMFPMDWTIKQVKETLHCPLLKT